MNTPRIDSIPRHIITRRAAVLAGVGMATALTTRTQAQDATPPDACPTLSPAEMEAQVIALVDAWNAQDLGQIETLLHPEHAHHWNGGADALDRDGYLAAMAEMFAAFDDLTFSIDAIIPAEDAAVFRFTLSGTQVGPFNGYPPSDQPATWTAIMIVRFRCGQIAEAWAEANHLGRLQQQGAIPLPNATPAS